MTEVALATIRPYGSLSGYIYLHLPSHICKSFSISPKSKFTVVWSDGKIILKQEVEDGTFVGISSAKAK